MNGKRDWGLEGEVGGLGSKDVGRLGSWGTGNGE